MGSKIVNLTRSFLPKLSINSKKNIESINSMPEMVLSKMRRAGDKSILFVDMNQCGAAIIKKNGITTVYTDSLCGCNSVGAAIQLKNGESLFMLSHYVPTNTQGQVSAISKQLEAYKPYYDTAQEPYLFFNIRGYYDKPNELTCVPNPIIEGVKNLFAQIFSKKAKVNIVPYENKSRPAFFSTANIFQFDPQNLKNVKITNVGEIEHFTRIG